MITSVLALSARPGCGDELEAFYADRRVLARALEKPGCRGARLLRTRAAAEHGSGPTHLVVAEWDGPDDYAGWVADPWRASLTHELSQLLETDLEITAAADLYDTVADRPTTVTIPEETS